MIENFTLLRDFLFTTLDKILVLYFSGGVLGFAFCIYIIRKLSTLIDKLR